jgi:hypothetical protein
VLTDAASGQGPGTLARKLSRCNEGMAQVLQFGYKAGLTLRVSRYKVDANDLLVMVQNFYALQWRGPGLSTITKQSWEQEQKKNRDKQLTFIVRATSDTICN